jgi:tetratricopeptide (TPR) repeat protein
MAILTIGEKRMPLNMIKEKTFEKKYKEKILQKYYNVVGTDSDKARSFIRMLNYRQDPYLLRCIAQTYFDESLFNNDGSQREYFDGRKLRLAEKYIIKAYILNEDCIDVLYTLGKIRNAFKQTDLAIYCYKRIIEVGRKKIPKKDTCTDRSFVQIKVNDSKFQLYRLYHDKGEFKFSKRYLSMYKKGLEKGIETIYKPLEKFLMD